MSVEIKLNSDHPDDLSSDWSAWAAERFAFEIGKGPLAERLAAVQKMVGGTTKLSDGIGVSPSGIKSWIGRGTEPGILKMVQLSRFSGVSVTYLATGEPEVDRDIDCELIRLDEYVREFPFGTPLPGRRAAINDLVAETRNSLEDRRRRLRSTELTPATHGLVLVPRLDVRASAGNGLVATADELYGEPSVVPFREQWLRQLGVAAANAQFLIAEGDSMFDTIAHGDLMLVDRGIDRVRSDGIYVVTYNGEVKVKRVQLLRDGTVLLKSDNPRYVTEEVPPHEVDQLAVAGRRPRPLGRRRDLSARDDFGVR